MSVTQELPYRPLREAEADMKAERFKAQLQLAYQAISKIVYDLFFVANANYLFAGGLFFLSFACAANPNNPILLWIEQTYGYSHLMWAYLLAAAAAILWRRARHLSILNGLLASPIVLLFYYAAQFVTLPDNPVYADETPYLTIALATIGGVNIVFTYYRSFVLRTINEHNIALKENNLKHRERIAQLEAELEEQRQRARANADAGLPS